MKKILIVDDEVNMRKVLTILFTREKYEVETASNGKEAVTLLEQGRTFDLILSDLKMPVMDGIQLLKYLKKRSNEVPVILITAYGTISEAVEAMKHGAVDFITKPFNKEDLRNMVFRILYREENPLPEKDDQYFNDEGVIYVSSKIRKIMENIRKIAPTNLSILLTGESGTGKSVIARAIHNYAFKNAHLQAPFVSINCPALPDTLLESELFGYKKGAFTGADKDFPGKVSVADGGTLFLDEIGDLSLTVQAKLLKLLEEGVYEPLGSTTARKAHIRILSATNQNIPEMIIQRRFREDLYYRINAAIFEIPSLRERKEDILPLTRYYIKKFSLENHREILTIPPEGIKRLTQYNWPGNIRELGNVLQKAVILSEGHELDIDSLPKNATIDVSDVSSVEKVRVEAAIQRNHGNISAAARELGMSRGSLRHRIKKYRISGYH